MTTSPQNEELPAGYEPVRLLADSRGVRVWLARRAGEELWLRLDPEAGQEARVELAVLSSVRHPGLGELLDHGPLPGGGLFVVRRWVVGKPLEEWAQGADTAAIGGLVAELCCALDALHQAGFVHGDIKPQNVIVREDGHPVLIDYGLARKQGEIASGGSWYALAPEQLHGAAADARSDLFGVGSLLHGLLVPGRAPAAGFHGRFPADTFFEASGTSAEDLPEWARDLVRGLVRRDPLERPPGALRLAHNLVQRLGLELGVQWVGEAGAPRIEPWFGREAFLEERISTPADGGLEVCTLPAGEDAQALARAGVLAAALRGVPAVQLDLEHEVRTLRGSAQQAGWAREWALRGNEAALWVHGLGSASAREAWSWLARARAAGQGPTWVLFLCPEEADQLELAGQAMELPVIAEGPIADFLCEVLVEEDVRVEGLAARLHAECGGTSTRLAALWDDLVAAKQVEWLSGWRLRQGNVVDWVGRSLEPAAGEASQDDVLEAALAWLGEARVAELAQTLELPASEVLAGIARLRQAQRIVDTPAGSMQARGRAPRLGARARELHGRVAQTLKERSSDAAQVALHGYLAHGEEGVLEDLLAGVSDRILAGLPHAAADLLARLRELAEDCARPFPEQGLEPLGVALTACGDLAAAEAVAQDLEARSRPLAKARGARIRGALARRLGQLEEAAEHYARAGAVGLDPDGASCLLQAMVLARGGDLAGLEQLAAAAQRPEDPRLAAALEVNLAGLRSTMLVNAGRAGEARKLLLSAQALARREGETRAMAPLETNFAFVARSEAQYELAETHLRTALAVYEQHGSLIGIAQIQAALGNLMRESGRLAEGQDWLERSLDSRRLLGQDAAGVLVRGGLALLLAERGHVAAALSELAAASAALGVGERAEERALMQLQAVNLHGMLGREMADLVKPNFARARAHWERYLWLRDHAAADTTVELGRIGLEADRAAVCAALKEPVPGDQALDLAKGLAERGVDGLAARLWLALAARGPAAERGAAEKVARRLFLRCAEGLTAAEADHLLKNLLAAPDPSPMDCSFEEDLDMDVIEILEINRRLVDQQDLPTLLRAIVRHAVEIAGAERGFLALEENGEFALDHALDSSHGSIDSPEVEVSYTVLREALAGQVPLRSSEAANDPLLSGAASVQGLELRSILAAPFEVQPGLRGVIYLDHRTRVGAFDARVERMLGLLASQAALAIRQVRRLEDIQALKTQLEIEVEDRGSRLEVAERVLAVRGEAAPVRGLLGESPSMRRVHELLAKIAPTDLSVLVMGASGTGKELAARALHDLSERSDADFVAENCAAIPANLLEAELFGARKGAFTGADRDTDGLFGRAHGGTLFLDEIAELPMELQAKLLRVLETRNVRRLGDEQEREVNFRLVGATHRNLDEAVAAGAFRADLLFRLDGIRIQMPSLAERVEDIPLLVDHFLRLEARRSGSLRKLSPAVMGVLLERAWPGNVRELSNEIARLCVLSDGDLIDPNLVRAANPASPVVASVLRPLADLERESIEAAIEFTGGDKRRAADLLGISRAKIYQRLKEWRDQD